MRKLVWSLTFLCVFFTGCTLLQIERAESVLETVEDVAPVASTLFGPLVGLAVSGATNIGLAITAWMKSRKVKTTERKRQAEHDLVDECSQAVKTFTELVDHMAVKYPEQTGPFLETLKKVKKGVEGFDRYYLEVFDAIRKGLKNLEVK